MADSFLANSFLALFPKLEPKVTCQALQLSTLSCTLVKVAQRC